MQALGKEGRGPPLGNVWLRFSGARPSMALREGGDVRRPLSGEDAFSETGPGTRPDRAAVDVPIAVRPCEPRVNSDSVPAWGYNLDPRLDERCKPSVTRRQGRNPRGFGDAGAREQPSAAHGRKDRVRVDRDDGGACRSLSASPACTGKPRRFPLARKIVELRQLAALALPASSESNRPRSRDLRRWRSTKGRSLGSGRFKTVRCRSASAATTSASEVSVCVPPRPHHVSRSSPSPVMAAGQRITPVGSRGRYFGAASLFDGCVIGERCRPRRHCGRSPVMRRRA